MTQHVAEESRPQPQRYRSQLGERPLEAVAAEAGDLVSFETTPLDLEDVEVFTAMFEIIRRDTGKFLPPALHPTNPPIASWVFTHAAESPYGPFTMVQLRISCRAALRPRAYAITSMIDNPVAGAAFSAGWGYRFAPGIPHVDFGYAATTATVRAPGPADGRQDPESTILTLVATDPALLNAGDIFWLADMVPAITPDGLQIVQVEPHHQIHQVERLRPAVRNFAPDAWTDPRIQLSQPVAATKATTTLHLPPIRYTCNPHEPAEEGTRAIG